VCCSSVGGSIDASGIAETPLRLEHWGAGRPNTGRSVFDLKASTADGRPWRGAHASRVGGGGSPIRFRRFGRLLPKGRRPRPLRLAEPHPHEPTRAVEHVHHEATSLGSRPWRKSAAYSTRKPTTWGATFCRTNRRQAGGARWHASRGDLPGVSAEDLPHSPQLAEKSTCAPQVVDCV
jgi:hypothetical protein